MWPGGCRGSWRNSFAKTAIEGEGGDRWPAGRSWLALVLGGYAVGAIAALGIGGSTLFAWGVGLGSVGSLGMLVVFFHSWLTLGIAIDVALLVAVLAGWYPR